jgi:hypothetical protein
MKSAALSAILLLSLQAFATISAMQSNASWTCSGTSCNVSFTSNPTGGNLIVVWTFWQSSTTTVTASVVDSFITPPHVNTYMSAVGPTLQSAASTPTMGQIFYAKNVNGGLPDTVTVTFSGSVASAGAVIVEYSGADPSNPLDSVSAGYSISAGTQFDSGFAAPTSSNVLVFGAGVTDSSYIPSAGSGFSSVQSHTSAITEQNILSGAPSSIPLQHATAVPPAGTPPPNGALSRALFAS